MLTPTTLHCEHYSYFQRGSASDVAPKTDGGFVLMGGGGDVDEAFLWMDEKGAHGDFLVLRGSGGDGYQDYLDELTSANSVQTLVLKDAQAAHDAFVLERVSKAEAIFLAGGDQWNYVGKWKDSPLLEALNAAILKGVPIGGTSAGLAVLGQHVFTAEKGTVTSEQALADPFQEKVTLSSEFLQAPVLEGLITDSHFSERDRMGRLVSFMGRLQQEQGLESLRGVGVDEGTAALVEPDGSSTVVGKGGVHWVRSGGRPEVCQSETPLTFQQLSVTSVKTGESFDLTSWKSPQVEPLTMTVLEGELNFAR